MSQLQVEKGGDKWKRMRGGGGDNFSGFLLFWARGLEMNANKASLSKISLHRRSLSNIDH